MTKSEPLAETIMKLKQQRNAVILAHNYQLGEVQDVVDFVGDSLELSQSAAKTSVKAIVFCGVHFMAEIASLLCPDKTVLLPDINSGCLMADMITAEELIAWKATHPGKKVVCYVNTSAEVKAESDICCTSANALRIVESLSEEVVLFVPDKNLANYVASHSSTQVIPWDGYCYVHNNMRLEHVAKKKKEYPQAEIWVHPECRPEVIEQADKVFSTGQMVKEASQTTVSQVIVGTEIGIIHRLQKINPQVEFIPLKETAVCSNMKKIDLMSVLKALELKRYQIEIDPSIREKAVAAIQKMISI